VFYEVDEPDYEAEGDAASNGRDYSRALTLYTMVNFSIMHLIKLGCTSVC
jgi:hypothetical protein